MGYMRDYRTKRLDAFDPARDIPGCFAWYDTSKLTGTNGAAVQYMGDESGCGNGVRQATSAAQPTLNTAALGGLNTLTFSATQALTSSVGSLGTFQARVQPLTLVVLCKLRSAGNAAAYRYILTMSGGAAATIGVGVRLAQAGVSDCYPFGYAGSGTAVNTGGRSVNDGAWHVIAVRMSTGFETVMVDGWLQAVTATAVHGTNTATGAVVLGGFALSPLALGFDGDFAEGGICAGDLTMKQMEHVTRYLATKWSV